MKRANLILQVLRLDVGKNKILSKDKIKNNDLILAIPSSGLHSNGYSLVRYLLKQKK